MKDNHKYYNFNVVKLAYEIIDMQRELIRLREENERLSSYEDKYNKLLNSSIEHNNRMMGNLLSATLHMDEDQISKAFAKTHSA